MYDATAFDDVVLLQCTSAFVCNLLLDSLLYKLMLCLSRFAKLKHPK